MPGIMSEKALAEQSLPPTLRLPPIRKIGSHSVPELSSSVKYLRQVYNPQVRGSRRRRRTHVYGRPSSSNDTKEANEAALYSSFEPAEPDAPRTNAFERSYAIRWLTALIAHLGGAEEVDEGFEVLLQDAASVLAICSGTAGAGVIVRDFSFPSPFDRSDTSSITIKLTDAPLENHDYGSVGAQTWGGACVMAELIAEDPASFGLFISPEDATASKRLRVLELGAGTGLVSLTVSKLMQLQNEVLCSSILPTAIPEVEVIATDYYPSILANLKLNIHSNLHSKEATILKPSGVAVSTHVLDWSLYPTTENVSPPLDEPFDVILGADIIYEAQHAKWIKSCLKKLLRNPHNDTQTLPFPTLEPLFHLIIPLRATHTLESNSIETVFPLHATIPSDMPSLNHTSELVIKFKDIFICDAGESGKDGEEVEYAYYQIGWGSTYS